MNNHLILIALTAALVPILETLARLDPSSINDWRAWGVGLATGVIRSLAVAVLTWWQSHPTEPVV